MHAAAVGEGGGVNRLRCECSQVVGRVFADHCLSLFQQGRLDPSTASMAKYWLTDLQNKIVDAGVQARRRVS